MDLKCMLEKVNYTNKSGISEFVVVEIGTGKRFLARGYLQEVKIGMYLILRGITEAKDNENITYQSAYSVISDENEAASLLSGADGISEKSAHMIIQSLGMDIFGYLDREGLREKLLSIPGIGASKADAVINFLKMRISSNEDYVWMMEHGISYTSTMKLIKEYGRNAKQAVIADPYSLLYKNQASFEVCDTIAREHGEDLWSESRIRAIIYTVLKKNSKCGNTYMDMDDFLNRCVRVSLWSGGIAVPDELFSLYAYDGTSCFTEVEGSCETVALWKLKQAEDSIIFDLNRLSASASKMGEACEELIQKVEEEVGIVYNHQQREAFNMFSYGGILILTGDPGTGKTTLVNGLIRYFLYKMPEARILLCAPTGRAASRLAEVSGRNAMTMHKAMKLSPYNAAVRVTEPLNFDLIIVEEMSMVDTELFALFLSSVPSGTTIVLTGDPDQLPSVGPGQVFRDLIDSGRFPIFHLTEYIRQEETSGIIKNARAALAGQKLKEYHDFSITLLEDDSDLATEAIRCASLCEKRSLILSPVNQGNSGIHALNRRMQEKYRKSERSIFINGTRFFVGDPIIMTHNNYKYCYYNGETGTLTDIGCGTITLSLPGRFLKMDISDACDIELAYVITIHRSQGTESEECVVVLPEYASHLASGQLLNTAFTRAKKRVRVVSTKRALKKYMNSNRAVTRKCCLLKKLRKETEH